MATFICIVVALCATLGTALPASRFFRREQQHVMNPIDYFLDNAEAENYYTQPQPKQASANGASSPLETLDPDSEVELVPGVQQPQPQPPQQNPVAPPNLPGFIPGQRVFIVHMPVPGYRPGTIGGYQPVYIVAASPQVNPGAYPQGNPGAYPQGNPGAYPQGNPGAYPQGNPGAYPQGNPGAYPQGNVGAYPVNGYQQNAILLEPSVRLMPVNHIYRPVVPQQNPGFFVGGSSALHKPYEIYPDPPNMAYQQPAPQEGSSKDLVRLAPQVEEQSTHPSAVANANIQKAKSTQPKRVSQASESKEQKDELRHYRPVSSQQSSPRPTS